MAWVSCLLITRPRKENSPTFLFVRVNHTSGLEVASTMEQDQWPGPVESPPLNTPGAEVSPTMPRGERTVSPSLSRVLQASTMSRVTTGSQSSVNNNLSTRYLSTSHNKRLSPMFSNVVIIVCLQCPQCVWSRCLWLSHWGTLYCDQYHDQHLTLNTDCPSVTPLPRSVRPVLISVHCV